MTTVPLSVIITTKNEADGLPAFIDALFRGSTSPAEVIIVDSCSQDATEAVVNERVKMGLPIRFASFECNRSEGRNYAVKLSTHPIIVCLDAGVTVGRLCFEKIAEYFAAHPEVDYASGAVRVSAANSLEEAFGLIVPQIPPHEEVVQGRWVPPSRLLVFRKQAFLAGPQYPVKNTRSEDAEFALTLHAQGVRFGFIEGADAVWPPRPTLKEFFRQYFSYAVGEGERGYFSLARFVKLLAYVVFLAAILTSPWVPWFTLCALLVALLYVVGVTYRTYRKGKSWLVIALTSVVEVTNDLADISGYVVGLMKYVRNPVSLSKATL